MNQTSVWVEGILLAAGRGRRFDPSGQQDKLLQTLPEGGIVAVRAAENLLRATPSVLAVLRPGALALADALSVLGCDITFCPEADSGMGASLAHAISQRPDARGWLIALADMPHVAGSTMQALVCAIAGGAEIAVPVSQGRRGNPVAFGCVHGPALLACAGDSGARHLLRSCAVTEVAVEDSGIWRDIDGPGDLLRHSVRRDLS